MSLPPSPSLADGAAPALGGIKELARRLGVSIGTVSRSLNNRSGVKPATRARVLEQARRMGYVANSAARRLKDRATLTIGLLFAPFLNPSHEINPVALQLIELFRKQAEAENMALRLIPYTSDDDLRKQVTAFHLDVIVFYGAFQEPSFGIVHEQGLPTLVLHHRTGYSDQVAVLVNTAEAGSRAVEYLTALGHERLGLVTGPRGSAHVDGFRQGFLEAMAEFRLPRRPEWEFELSPATSNKEGATAALLPILGRADRPTAVVFTSDWLALGGYKAARDLSLRMPDDLSIVGFDNVPITSELTPPLTTFDLDTPKLAKKLTEIAKDLGSRRWNLDVEGHRTIFLTPALIKRGSCACLRAAAGVS